MVCIISKMPNIKKISIREVKFGNNCTIIEPVNLYECELGDNVFVGPFVEITKGVKIGNSTRISSHSFVCELVSIGKNCFIGANSLVTKDLSHNKVCIKSDTEIFKLNSKDFKRYIFKNSGASGVAQNLSKPG